MKVLQIIRKEFIKNQPLQGIRISACLPRDRRDREPGYLPAADGGADVVLCASNPLSTQDDVAASLVRDHSIPVFAIKGGRQRNLLQSHPRRHRSQTAHHHG